MVIILTGLDNVGKTTQTAKLQQILTDKPLHQIHYTALKGFDDKSELINYTSKMYTQMFSMTKLFNDKAHFIIDRFHIDEAVYAPMYRSYSGDYVFEIEDMFNKTEFWNDVYLITFIDSIDNVIKRDDGLSHSIDPKLKQKEIEGFIKAHDKSSIKNKYLMDIEGKDIDTVFKEICKFIKK